MAAVTQKPYFLSRTRNLQLRIRYIDGTIVASDIIDEEVAMKMLDGLNETYRPKVMEEVAAWIEPQRNDLPATGEEFAAAIRFWINKEAGS